MGERRSHFFQGTTGPPGRKIQLAFTNGVCSVGCMIVTVIPEKVFVALDLSIADSRRCDVYKAMGLAEKS